MAGVYKVSEKELSFLMLFAEKQGMQGLGELPPIDTQKDARECVEILCEKGYLHTNQKKEYEMDSTLELLLTAAERPYGYCVMEDLRQNKAAQKTAVYFLNDVIAIIEQKENDYELFWIPYLPLAIGEVANLHTPFLNKATEMIRKAPVSEVSECIDRYLKAGYTWQWEIWGKQLDEEEKAISMFVLSNGKEQIMVKEEENDISVFKPDKADYVNTITRWLAFVHGKAMKKMIEEA